MTANWNSNARVHFQQSQLEHAAGDGPVALPNDVIDATVRRRRNVEIDTAKRKSAADWPPMLSISWSILGGIIPAVAKQQRTEQQRHPSQQHSKMHSRNRVGGFGS